MVRFLGNHARREAEEEREREKRETEEEDGVCDYFKFLPLEIKLDILTRLPTESVLDSKLVCTNWRSVIAHPSFSKMHFHLHHLNHPSAESGKLGFLVSTCSRRYGIGLHYFEYHDQLTTPIQRIRRVNLTSQIKNLRVAGSCDGLICLLDYNTPPSVCICNPITRECLILPKIRNRDRDIDKHAYDHGSTFGYVPSTNEYKVVVTIYKEAEAHFQVHIYTLGSGNGWRNLGNFNSGYNLDHKVSFANGSLYWLDHKLKMFGSFDLAQEKVCQHLSPPPMPPLRLWLFPRFGVLDGFLYFVTHALVDGFYDIWLLNEKNHDHDKEEGEQHPSLGWSKEFRIDDMKSKDLLAVTKRDCVLRNTGNHFINIHDTKTSTSKSLVKFYGYIHEVFAHKNTLVSLKELGEKDAKVMESAEIEETYSSEESQEDESSEQSQEDESSEESQEDADPEFIYL